MNKKMIQRLLNNPHYKTSKQQERQMFEVGQPEVHTAELQKEEVKLVRKGRNARRKKKQQTESASEQNIS
jgi:23S rRNA maturation mini-RNase III